MQNMRMAQPPLGGCGSSDDEDDTEVTDDVLHARLQMTKKSNLEVRTGRRGKGWEEQGIIFKIRDRYLVTSVFKAVTLCPVLGTPSA